MKTTKRSGPAVAEITPAAPDELIHAAIRQGATPAAVERAYRGGTVSAMSKRLGMTRIDILNLAIRWDIPTRSKQEA
jgi:hypothetical protein